MTATPVHGRLGRHARSMLGLAAVSVGFAAADNYVVVLALPDMMGAVGMGTEDLHEAAPVVSGFLLGYIAVLPLIGRISDLRGRAPVLLGSLVVFGLGSLVTATSYDLTTLVAGRVVQGIGAGGLLPATLALVADTFPTRRRGVPLGVVGAVQELGNVAGPVYGAVVLAAATWRWIFWVNFVVAVLLGAGIARRHRRDTPGEGRGTDLPGLVLALSALGCLLLVMTQPRRLVQDLTWGAAFVPVVGDGRWTTPVALAVPGLTGLLVVRGLLARHPLLDVRGWCRTLAQVDLLGTLLLSLALAGVIVTFATADPSVQVVAPSGAWLLVLSAGCALLFWRRNRTARRPLVPPGALAQTPAWGALVVSVLVGAAVVAALVDIPIFARVTVYHDSQLMAALTLVRFFVGLPIGALCGGWLTRRLRASTTTALGMVLSAAGFTWMSRWPFDALESGTATVPLFAAGLGVGLAMAPVNAAMLAATPPPAHGLTSALLVVARTIGKLVGISVLTTIGLNRYYAARADVPSPAEVCGIGESRCHELNRLLQETALVQLHTVFFGAAVCCVLAALAGLVVLRGARTTDVPLAGSLLG